MNGSISKIKSEASSLSAVGDNQEALRVCNDLSNHMDRIERIYSQKKATIEGAFREHCQNKKKSAEAQNWLKSVQIRLSSLESAQTPAECQEKLRIINDIRSQAIRYSSHIPQSDWRNFDKLLTNEMQNTEMKLIELGHFESALDEVRILREDKMHSDWLILDLRVDKTMFQKSDQYRTRRKSAN